MLRILEVPQNGTQVFRIFSRPVIFPDIDFQIRFYDFLILIGHVVTNFWWAFVVQNLYKICNI